MPTKGYDIFYTEPDTVETMDCLVCGTRCNVERSLHGPTGLAEAMGRSGHWHDKFGCPYSGQLWHDKALKLVPQIETTPSKRLAALLRQDLADLLREKKSEPEQPEGNSD